MIFKTFNNDIDNITAKIGIFGKSFKEIANIINSRKNAINDLTNAEHLDPSEVGSLWNYIFPSKEEMGSPIIDVDSLLPKIDETQAQNLLTNLIDLDSQVKAGIISWDDYYKKLQEGEKWQIDFIQNADLQKSCTEDLINANQQARQAAIDHNNSLKQQTFSAKAGKAAMQAFSTALNVGASIAISLAVQKAAEAIDNYVHRVEKAREALSETTSKLNEVTSTMEENQKLIDELEAKETLPITDEDDLQRLKEENKELRIQQKLLEAQKENDEKKVADYAKEDYEKKYGSSKFGTSQDTVNAYKEAYHTTTAPAKLGLSNNYLTGNASDSAQNESTTAISFTEGESNLTRLIAEYEIFTDKKSQLIKNTNPDTADIGQANKELEGYEQKLKELETGLINSRTELQGFADDLSLGDGNSEELTEIEGLLGLIDNALFSTGENLANFLNSSVSSSEVAQLTALAETGKLTADELKTNFSDVNSYLEQNGITMEDFISILGMYRTELEGMDTKAATPFDTSAALEALSSLEASMASFRQAYASLLDGENVDPSSLNGIKDSFAELENADMSLVNDALNRLADAGSMEDARSAINALAEEYLKTSGVLDILNDENKELISTLLGGIGYKNADELVTNKLSKAAELLTSKEGMLISAKERAAAQEAFSEAKKHNSAIASENLAAATYDEISAILAEGNVSMDATACLARLALSKLDLTQNPIDTVGEVNQIIALANAAGTSAAYVDGLREALLSLVSASTKNYTADFGMDTADTGKKKDVVNARVAAEKELNKFLDNTVQFNAADYYADDSKNPTASSASGGSDSPNTGQQAAEAFDFIETRIRQLESSYDRLQNKAQQAFRSMSARAAAYTDAIHANDSLLETQEAAKTAYEKQRDAVGLEAAYAAKVQEGSLKIESIRDPGLKEKINQYRQWHDKVLACTDAMDALHTEQSQLKREKLQLEVDAKTGALDRLESRLDRLQRKMDLKEAFGLSASRSDYTGMAKNYTAQLDNLGKTNKLLKKQQKEVEKGSGEWNSYQQQINSNNNSMQDLLVNLAEASKQLADMPLNRAAAKNEKLDKNDDLYGAKIDTAASASKKNFYINKEISGINSRNRNYQTAYAQASGNLSSTKGNLKQIYRKNKSSGYTGLFKTAYGTAKSGKKIPESLFTSISNAIAHTDNDGESRQLQRLLRYCSDWNSRLCAQEEAGYNAGLSLLTTASGRKEKWDTQRENTIRSTETAVSSATSGNSYSHSSKNSALRAQNNALKKQDTAYADVTKKAYQQLRYQKKGSDANTAYKALGTAGKKASGDYKKALTAARSCIKGKKAIPKDVLKTIQKHNQSLYNKCTLYNQDLVVYENAKYEEAVNYAATSAERYSNQMGKYDNRLSAQDTQDALARAKQENQTTARGRNEYVSQQIQNVNDRLGIYADAATETTAEYNTRQRSLSGKKAGSAKAKNADESVWKKYSPYVKKAVQAAKSKKEISASVMAGLLAGVEKGAVRQKFYQLCIDYNNSLQNKKQAEDEYELYQETARQEKADLAMEKFDNIAQEYDNKRSVNEHTKNTANAKIALAQAQGKAVSPAYYDELITAEKADLGILGQERTDLQNSLNQSIADGTIAMGSEEWYKAMEAIHAVSEEIDNGTLALLEYKNAQRQLKWDAFDDALEGTKRLNAEADYYISRLSRETLVDEDTGAFTDAGSATLALRKANLDNYLSQAKKYQAEYGSLLRQIANGELSAGDENVLARLRELEDARRDATLAAEDEKQAVLDLVRQGYDAQLGSLGKLISNYKELRRTGKDAYEYQKSIAEKTKNISGLQKQLAAMGGDISEENRADIQRLKLELESAQEDLNETRYEKYLSDSEEMLDEMYADYEQFINGKLDNASAVLAEVLENNLGESSAIVTTLANLDANLTQTLTDILKGNITTDENASGTSPDIRGFKNGARHIPRAQLAFTQENGTELLYRASDGSMLTPLGPGDKVWTAEMSENLWQLAQGNMAVPDYIQAMTFTTPEIISNTGIRDTNVNVTIDELTLPNVTNYQEFKTALIQDRKFEKAVQAMTIDKLSGKTNHSMRKYQYL